MAKIFEVKALLSKAVSEYRSLVAKEADLPTDETLPDEDTSRLAVLEKDIAVLTARVDRLEALDALPDVDMSVSTDNAATTDEKAAHATGMVSKQFASASQTRQTLATPTVEKGLQIARYMIGKAYGLRNGPRAAADFISKSFGDEMVAKALSVSGTGATTIPTYFSTDLIELLRPLVAVRNAGAATIDTTGGQITLPRFASAATANWTAEMTDITTSNATIDTVVLSNHKLVAMTVLSNDLLRRSPLGLDQIVRDDLLAVMARTEDVAFLTGTGSGNSPTGLRAQSGIQTVTAAGSDLANCASMVNGMVTKLQMANTRMIRPAWIASPMTYNFLANKRDGLGGWFAFKEEVDSGKLAGYPIYSTTNLPVNLSNYLTANTGTNGSDIFLIDAADVLIGDTLGVGLETSTEASFVENGTLQSAFSKDATVFRVISETDLVLRHATSVVWGKVDAWTLY